MQANFIRLVDRRRRRLRILQDSAQSTHQAGKIVRASEQFVPTLSGILCESETQTSSLRTNLLFKTMIIVAIALAQPNRYPFKKKERKEIT